jgi:hypothetical protein
MAQDQNRAGAGRGGFLRILGIIYLIKLIRRRKQRRPREADGSGAAG